MLYLGVDGGNTKTIALLCTAEGNIVGTGRAGCADIFHAPSVEAALGEVSRAIDSALRAAEAEAASIDSATFSLAGIDWPEDADLAQTHFAKRGYGRRLTVANDALGGLRAGTADGTGIVIAYGTGGVIGARNRQGAFWHTGFWAEPMGGSLLGQEAIRLVMRSDLGLEPETALRPLLLRHFAVPDVHAMVRLLNGHNIAPITNVGLAKLAPLVMQAAQGGDSIALGIIEQQAQLLAEYAQVAARRMALDVQNAATVLTGGVFRHPGGLLADLIAMKMRRPADSFQRPQYEPAMGALMLALECSGITVNSRLLENLSRSAPGATFYDTVGQA